MNDDILKELAAQLCAALHKRRAMINACSGRFPKKQLFLALNKCKPVLERRFGGPVTSRWSVGKKEKPPEALILEYLVDYGICRYSIPQAIRQPKQSKPELQAGQYYEILLAVESELGDDHEVTRDFLKLLDVKSRIKCLVFRKRPDEQKTLRLYERIEWIVSHHNLRNPEEQFLLVGLPKAKTATLIDDIEFRCITD